MQTHTDPILPPAMTQHPRTPGTFWREIGWQDQIDACDPIRNCGPALRRLREAAGLNQPELARRIDSSQNRISIWETGVEPIPRRWIAAIEEACNGVLDMRAHYFGGKAAQP
jgi:DNA-binding XRE family transcriptional regulator